MDARSKSASGVNAKSGSAIWSSEKYTNVPMIPSIIVAIAGGSITLGISLLLKGAVPYIYSLIQERGWIQYLTIYCFWFALGMLAFKWWKLRKERSAFDLPYVKHFTAGRDIVGTSTILEQLSLIRENVDAQQKDLILISRINKGLKQLKVGNTPAEVANVLSTAATTDSAIIDSSYVPIKFMIWIIPILGFVGTVMGMSQAIGSFNVVLKGVKDVGFQGVMSGLGTVTAGLAVAFDTTFLALVLSAVINLISNIIQKKEEDLLSDVEDFTTENIVNKLAVAPLKPAPGPAPAMPDWSKLTDALEGLLREFKNMSKQNQVNANGIQEQLGKVIEAIGNANKGPIADGELPEALKEFSQTLKDNARSFKAIGDLEQLIKTSAEVMENLKAPIEEMASVNKGLREIYKKIYRIDS